MTTSALGRLQSAKKNADSMSIDRDNYAAYVADRIEFGGWSDEDVTEYRAEVARIMKSGTPDEKLAARKFWQLKADENENPAAGANQRIRSANAEAARLAA